MRVTLETLSYDKSRESYIKGSVMLPFYRVESIYLKDTSGWTVNTINYLKVVINMVNNSQMIIMISEQAYRHLTEEFGKYLDNMDKPLNSPEVVDDFRTKVTAGLIEQLESSTKAFIEAQKECMASSLNESKASTSKMVKEVASNYQELSSQLITVSSKIDIAAKAEVIPAFQGLSDACNDLKKFIQKLNRVVE